MGATGQSAETQTTPGQPSDDEEAVLCAMQLANAASLPMVLKTALELDILEIMARSCPAAGGLISPAEIAAQLPTSNVEAPAMLDRILRLLASYSILTCKLDELPGGKVERLYGLAPVCKFLTKNEDGVSLAPLCLMHHDKVHMGSWHYLKDAILEGGIAFDKAYGVNAFDYHGTDLRFNQVFNRGLFNHSTFFMKKILETYDGFQGLNTVVDVGGGTGAVLRMIVSKYPSIKGINFDLPHVIADATPFPGVEHVPGDMFVSVPKGEAIFMKGICHDWDDEHCLKLLKNCHAALPDDHGKVIVAECILPVCPDPSLATKEVFHFDCMMMTQHGGKERMEDEFEALAERAGFEGFRVACRVLNKYVMELIKKA